MCAVVAHPVAAVEVPAARRPVVRAAHDEVTGTAAHRYEVTGTDEAVDGRLVALEDGHALARRHVPLANRLVGAAAPHVRVLDQHAVDVIVGRRRHVTQLT